MLTLQNSGNVYVTYHLGTQDIAVGDPNVVVNDGKYHVIRFTRSGANSTLQIDDNQIQTKHVTGGHDNGIFATSQARRL